MSSFIRSLTPRDPEELHRTATPLELFFDLVSVIAIAAAAAGLHHAIAQARTLQGILTFLMAFFAIWWAWMNYTWFASAYDNDDTLFRLLTILIIAGSLTLASGTNAMFKSGDLTLVVIGYVIMRVGMTALWFRAANNDPSRCLTAMTYVKGIGLLQIFWVIYALLQPMTPILVYSLYGLGILLELAVPVLAERKGKTPWHRHHIIERYGLLNIIVLGETLLAGSLALQQLGNGATDMAFLHTALSSLVIVFSMWWLYFSEEDHLAATDLHRALIWGYGHFIIFASGAAVGAGFAVLVDVIAEKTTVSLLVGDYAVGIPVSLYMLGLWFVRDRFCLEGAARYVLPGFALLILSAPFVQVTLEGIAAMTALCVVVREYLVKLKQVVNLN